MWSVTTDGFTLQSSKVDDHVRAIREAVNFLKINADLMAALVPAQAPSWTGSNGSHALLRASVLEIIEVLRRADTSVNNYNERATACLTNYHAGDKAAASALGKCMADFGK